MAKEAKQTSDSAERVAALRRELERLKGATTASRSASDEAEDAKRKRPLSAREFINKRMAELDKRDD
jgi:precorrin-6B methylase 1